MHCSKKSFWGIVDGLSFCISEMCLGWNCEHGTSEQRDHDDPQRHVTSVGKFFCPSAMVDSETQGVQYYAVLAIKLYCRTIKSMCN